MIKDYLLVFLKFYQTTQKHCVVCPASLYCRLRHEFFDDKAESFLYRKIVKI